MDAVRFLSPVRVRVNGVGRDVECLSEALAFLNGWPTQRQGPVYDTALRSCRAAASGQMTTESARASFDSFVRITGLSDRPVAKPHAPLSVVASAHALKTSVSKH